MLLTNEEIRTEMANLKRLANRPAKLDEVEDGMDSYRWLWSHISEREHDATSAERAQIESYKNELRAIEPKLIRKYEGFNVFVA